MALNHMKWRKEQAAAREAAAKPVVETEVLTDEEKKRDMEAAIARRAIAVSAQKEKEAAEQKSEDEKAALAAQILAEADAKEKVDEAARKEVERAAEEELAAELAKEFGNPPRTTVPKSEDFSVKKANIYINETPAEELADFLSEGEDRVGLLRPWSEKTGIEITF